jgi:YidC/Oxa1 family membrane protein insertase
MPDQKNLMLAIVLSIAIILGFSLLFPQPVPPPPAPADTATTATTPGTTTALPDSAGAVAIVDRAQALAADPRIRIQAPRVDGSISLRGAKLDDLTLRDYRETVDPASPEVVLLTPRSAPAGYYVDGGWAPVDPSVPVPDADTLWTADRDVLTATDPVTLTWNNGQGLVFERTIAIDANYMFTVTQRVRNEGTAPVALAPYSRTQRIGHPVTLGYYLLHEGPYGVFDDTLQEHSYSDMSDDGTIKYRTTGGWLGFTDKYWLVALVPDQSAPVDAEFIYQPDGQGRYLATFQGAVETVDPGQTIEDQSHVFAGAKEVALIGTYADNLGITKFDKAIDFGWFAFLTKPFFYILAWIHSVVGNFGIAIMIFTVMLKLLFFPLADKSYRSMAKMKGLQPQMTALREQYGDDRQKLNQEMMALYKREKVNPAAGCLPILIQIPIFFSLYKVLFVTIEMRHAPFFGWIQDLSAPDPTTLFNLFGLIPWTPPHLLMIGIWPLIMGLTMFLQQKLNPTPADPIQARIFMFLPIIFTVMLAGFASGLVIYWAWNNTLSIAQQWVIMKRMGVKIGGGIDKEAVAAAAPTAVLPPSVARKAARAEKARGDEKPSAPATPARRTPAQGGRKAR